MYIKEVYIGAFGALHERTVTFADGVNLIEGENEAGKSTLCAFIKFIFYGLSAKAKNNAMPDRKRYMPFDGSSAYGTLTLCEGGRDYRISRTLTMTGKTAARNEYSIIDCATGERVFDGMEPCDAFLSMSEGLFVRTAYVPQLAGSTVDGTEVSKAIENLLFSAEEEIDSAKALKALDSARAEILHKNAKGGKLYEARTAQDEAIALLREVQGVREEIAQKQEHLDSLRKSESENARLTEEAEMNLRKYELASRLIDFYEADKLAEQLCALQEKRDALTPGGKTPTSEDIYTLIRLSGEIKSAESELERRRSERQTCPQEEQDDLIERDGGAAAVASRLKKLRSGAKSCRIFGAVLITIGVPALCAGGAAAAGIFGAFPVSAGYPMGAGAALVLLGGILLGIGAGKAKRLLAELARYGVNDPEQIADRASRAQSMRLIYKKEADERQAELDRLSANQAEKLESAKELCEQYETVYETADSLETLAARLTAIREGCVSLDSQIERTNERVQEAYTALAEYDRDTLTAEVGGDPYEVQRSLDYKELKSRLTFGSASKENIRAKIVELEKSMLAEQSRVRREQELREQVQTLTVQIESYVRRCDALRLAYDKIEEAAQSLKEHVSPSLAKRAGELLGKVSGGKYDTLWVADDMSLTYADRAFGGTARDANYLSCGAKDLAYIALRIALCELLCQGKALPMIFDESFAAIDDTRLAQVFSVISARGAQSLIFTSQKRDRTLLPDAHITAL